jgi:CHASE1-domain containing sensor protein
VNSAPLAVALALLLVSIAVAFALIPALDGQERRTTERWAANDNTAIKARRPERQFG